MRATGNAAVFLRSLVTYFASPVTAVKARGLSPFPPMKLIISILAFTFAIMGLDYREQKEVERLLCLIREAYLELQSGNTENAAEILRDDAQKTRLGKPIETKDVELRAGDYVLATKYEDGDPKDHWAIGFYSDNYGHFGQTRYIVIDEKGTPFRANGFRRVEKISKETGQYMLSHVTDIELCGRSVWDFATGRAEL